MEVSMCIKLSQRKQLQNLNSNEPLKSYRHSFYRNIYTHAQTLFRTPFLTPAFCRKWKCVVFEELNFQNQSLT